MQQVFQYKPLTGKAKPYGTCRTPCDRPVPYEPRRFQSAVPYYERYRLGYPERLIARVVALLGLAPGDAVLDLGCGPGSLAVPFAKAGMAVTAADPEPEMLAARGGGGAGCRRDAALWQGGSYDLTPDMGPYRLVSIGRAFHWMDRRRRWPCWTGSSRRAARWRCFTTPIPMLAENRWFKMLCKVGDKYGRAVQRHISASARRWAIAAMSRFSISPLSPSWTA